MTDVVAQNLFVDGRVAKAPNLALAQNLLPSMPATGDILIYTGDVFRGVAAWDSGTDGPVGARAYQGCSGTVSGTILLATRTRIYALTNEIWDSGVEKPPTTNGYVNTIRGITVDSSGAYWMVSAERAPGNQFRGGVWTYANGTWDRQFTFLHNDVRGIGIDSTGDVLIVAVPDPPNDTGMIFRVTGGVPDSGTALPSGAGNPQGFGVGLSDEWLLVDFVTDRLYTLPAGGSWDSGIALPSGATEPFGVGVLPNGSIVVCDNGGATIYIRATDNAALPSARGLVRWSGTLWENL